MPKFKNALLLKSAHRQLTTQGATNPQSVNTATSGDTSEQTQHSGACLY